MNRTTPFTKPSSLNRVLSHELRDTIKAIEHTYALYAGPIAQYVIPETYQDWSSKYQPRLATLIKYVNHLAATLPRQADTENFTIAASGNILSRRTHLAH